MRKFYILIPIILVLAAACNKPTEPTPEGPYGFASSEEMESMAYTDTPEPEVIEPTEEPNIHLVEPPDPARVAYDFTTDYCSAAWSTNATFLPCPMNLDEAEGAYIEATDHTVLEGMVSVEAPLLIGLPGSAYPTGLGLFGKYPPFLVYPGDVFHAAIACQGDAECDLDFWLEYYPPGATRAEGWEWHHQSGDGPQEVTADLRSLAGQSVEFYLVMRPQEDFENQWAVWIQPYIERDPDAEPAPTPEPQPTAEPASGDTTPGVITGMVDMSSAPPYLNDPHAGSSPVAVVFFNLSDGTYWWIHTSLTGHPYFQMTITPGEYQVAAYGWGVGEMPYVSAGYTGSNPSCGKNLKTITMKPNGRVENIVIADWNWTCGGDAYRPNKPGGVPLP